MEIKMKAGVAAHILQVQLPAILELEMPFKIKLKLINQAKAIEESMKQIQLEVKDYVDSNFDGVVPEQTILVSPAKKEMVIEGDGTEPIEKEIPERRELNPKFLEFQKKQAEFGEIDLVIECNKILMKDFDELPNNNLKVNDYLVNFVKE